MALRIPSPKALTKPEAYLAYKAGIMSRDELKQSVYNPLNNYEGWLAKWCGLLETYPTNEDGTPQCLTDEEGLLAYLCGVTNRYPASNSRPDDARISAYIRYLVSARYTRPDHPLNREEFYLSIIKTQFIPSGDPSSDIVIDGTTKAPFVDVRLYGDTAQNSYTGKNLFVGELYTTPHYGLSFSYAEGGGIHVYGTPTQEWIPVTLNAADGVKTVDIASGTTLSFACDWVGAGIRSLTMRVRNTDSPNDSTDDLSSTVPTKTTTKDNNYTMLWIRATAGTLVDAYIKAQVTATDAPDYDYEPFVGGIESPSEFYQQVIETVTGRQVVDVNGGKNLFNKNNYRTLNVYVRNAQGELVYGTGVKSVIMRCIPNTTYTISKTNAGVQPRFCVFSSEKNPEPLDVVNVIGGTPTGKNEDTSVTVTTGPNDEWMGVFLWISSNDVSFENIVDTLQVEIGETATEYEEYTGTEYEINLGKNIADMSTYNYGNILADGTITDSTDFCRSNMFQIEEGAIYSVWVDNSQETDRGIRVAFYDGHKQFMERYSSNPNESGYITVGAPNGAQFMVIAFTIRTGMHRVQIEAGEKFTGYAGYFKPIELGVLEGKSDRIFKEYGVWKIHRETYIGELDGSADENWYVSSKAFKCNNLSQKSVGTTYESLGWPEMSSDYYSYNVPSSSHGYMGEAYCTGFKRGKAWDVVAGTSRGTFGLAGINTAGGNSAIYIDSIQGLNITGFREYLALDPIRVMYVLQTPYDEEITNQALIEQLEALQNGGAEEGKTIIRLTAPYPELPAKLYVEAPKYD